MAVSLGASVTILVSACGRDAAPSNPQITLLASPNPSQPSRVEVRGLSSRDLSILRRANLTADTWPSVLTITAGENQPSSDVPPVQGRYAVTDAAVTFTPLFPFDPGRRYRVTFNPSRVPGADTAAAEMTTVVGLPARATAPKTVITAVYPSAAVVPENLLRMYVEFSAPMGNGVPREHIHIVEVNGREVKIPFLPIDADLWNPDHTRATVLFDPGRVKQGILPNKELGRPLHAGGRYTLEINVDWPDADGQPLKAPFRHEFRVGPPAEQAINLSSWRLDRPPAASRAPLVVVFPAPLDHALLARALRVETRDGRPVDGEILLEADDTRWRFTPLMPWARGDFNLVANSVLEDPAGNRIGSPFEAQGNARGSQGPDEFRVAFTVANATP